MKKILNPIPRTLSLLAIEVAKPAVRFAIESLAEGLPELAEDSVNHPNTKTLIEVREEFFKRENNDSRNRLFRAIWKLLIIIYDYDPYYRDRMDWVKKEIEKREWKGIYPNRPRRKYWRKELDIEYPRKT